MRPHIEGGLLGEVDVPSSKRLYDAYVANPNGFDEYYNEHPPLNSTMSLFGGEYSLGSKAFDSPDEAINHIMSAIRSNEFLSNSKALLGTAMDSKDYDGFVTQAASNLELVKAYKLPDDQPSTLFDDKCDAEGQPLNQLKRDQISSYLMKPTLSLWQDIYNISVTRQLPLGYILEEVYPNMPEQLGDFNKANLPSPGMVLTALFKTAEVHNKLVARVVSEIEEELETVLAFQQAEQGLVA